MRHSAGFSLVEVLVSVVVLSVALLGTAGLMGASLRSTNTSYYRTQATVLADDILDRMRANLTAAAVDQDYDIDPGPAYAAPGGSMALYDCTEWTTTVAATLPNGVGTVNVDPAGVATIEIEWGDVNENRFRTQSRL